jgi:hypothetical protein
MESEWYTRPEELRTKNGILGVPLLKGAKSLPQLAHSRTYWALFSSSFSKGLRVNAAESAIQRSTLAIKLEWGGLAEQLYVVAFAVEKDLQRTAHRDFPHVLLYQCLQA